MATSTKVDYDEDEKHIFILALRCKDIKNVDGVMGRAGGSFRNKLLKGVDRMFGQSDPYYQIRNVDNEVVAQSEVVMNDLKPSFAPLFIDMERLCGGNAHNFHQPFTITFYDWQPKGQQHHRFLGTITTSVHECMDKADEYQEALQHYALLGKQGESQQQRFSFRRGSRNKESKSIKNIEPSFALKVDGEDYGKVYCTKAQVAIGTPTPLQKELIIRKRRRSSSASTFDDDISTSASFDTTRSWDDGKSLDGKSLDGKESQQQQQQNISRSSSVSTIKSISTTESGLAAVAVATAAKKKQTSTPQQIDTNVQQTDNDELKTPTSTNASSVNKKGQSSPTTTQSKSLLPPMNDEEEEQDIDNTALVEMTAAPTNYILPQSFDVSCSLFVLELKATNLFYGVFRHANSYKIAHHDNKTTSATSWSQDHLMGGADFFYCVATRHAIVAQSTVHMKNLHPTFAPLAIGVESLRRGFQLTPRSPQDEDGVDVQDAEILLNGELYLWFFDWEEDGKHTPMGYIKTSLRRLLQASLHRKKNKRRKSKRRKSGNSSSKGKEEEEDVMLSQITMNNIQYGKVYVTHATFVEAGLPTFWDPSQPTIIDDNEEDATVSQKDAVDDDGDGGGKPKSIKKNDEEENDGVKSVSRTSSMVLEDDLLDSSAIEVGLVMEKQQDGNDDDDDDDKEMDASSRVVDDSTPHEEGIEVVGLVPPSSALDDTKMSREISFSDNDMDDKNEESTDKAPPGDAMTTDNAESAADGKSRGLIIVDDDAAKDDSQSREIGQDDTTKDAAATTTATENKSRELTFGSAAGDGERGLDSVVTADATEGKVRDLVFVEGDQENVNEIMSSSSATIATTNNKSRGISLAFDDNEADAQTQQSDEAKTTESKSRELNFGTASGIDNVKTTSGEQTNADERELGEKGGATTRTKPSIDDDDAAVTEKKQDRDSESAGQLTSDAVEASEANVAERGLALEPVPTPISNWLQYAEHGESRSVVAVDPSLMGRDFLHRDDSMKSETSSSAMSTAQEYAEKVMPTREEVLADEEKKPTSNWLMYASPPPPPESTQQTQSDRAKKGNVASTTKTKSIHFEDEPIKNSSAMQQKKQLVQDSTYGKYASDKSGSSSQQETGSELSEWDTIGSQSGSSSSRSAHFASRGRSLPSAKPRDSKPRQWASSNSPQGSRTRGAPSNKDRSLLSAGSGQSSLAGAGSARSLYGQYGLAMTPAATPKQVDDAPTDVLVLVLDAMGLIAGSPDNMHIALNPFLEVADGDGNVIARSEVLIKSNDSFMPLAIPMGRRSVDAWQDTLFLTFFDWQMSDKHDIIGQTKTTPMELKGMCKTKSLVKLMQDNVQTGELMIRDVFFLLESLQKEDAPDQTEHTTNRSISKGLVPTHVLSISLGISDLHLPPDFERKTDEAVPNCFFEVLDFNGNVVSRSDVIMNNDCPIFPRVNVPMHSLSASKNSGREQVALFFLKLYHWDKFGRHHVLGMFKATAKRLKGENTAANFDTKSHVVVKGVKNGKAIMSEGTVGVGFPTGKDYRLLYPKQQQDMEEEGEEESASEWETSRAMNKLYGTNESSALFSDPLDLILVFVSFIGTFVVMGIVEIWKK